MSFGQRLGAVAALTPAAALALALGGCGTAPPAPGAASSAISGTPPGGVAVPVAAAGSAGAHGSFEKCERPLGTLGVVEDPNATWYQALRSYKLGSTVPLLRLMVQQSNCFVIIERGRATRNMNTERALQQWDEMRAASKAGKGQMVSADYTMSPTITFSQNTGGAIGGLGGLSRSPGAFGVVGGSLKANEASTTLIMTDNRSGLQLAAAEGSANNMVSNLGATAAFSSELGAAAAGAYAKSPEGKTITAAFIDSYNQLVRAVRNYKAQTVEGGLGTGGTLGVQGGSTPTSKAPQQPTPKPAAPSTPPYTVVKVHFATDRQDSGDRSLGTSFLPGRGTTVTYGVCEISIPRLHQIGQLERPSIFASESRAKHVVVARIERQDETTFWQTVRQRIPAGSAESALIFVHGYNVGFEEAARRTAQVASDIGFRGVPMFFSWPSGNALQMYWSDSTNVEWAEPDLRKFLKDVVRQSGAKDIYLVAHSMGSRALTRAWVSLSTELTADERVRVREVILAAPDIDADIFRRSLVPGLVAAGVPVTLYASAADRALQASKTMNGFARAGDAGDGLVIADGIETIDATEVGSDLIGHGYVLDVRAMLADVASVVKRERAGQRFGLMAVDDGRGTYWRLKK